MTTRAAGPRGEVTTPPPHIPTSVSVCNGPRCGREIRWAMTEQGRRIPLDYEPDPNGNVIIVNVGGKHRARILSGRELPAQQQAWMPHHKTCIDSETYRARQHAAMPKCGKCRTRMDPWLIEHGYTTHIGC